MTGGDLSTQLLHEYGYVGLGLGLLVNCMGIPISGEVLLPLTGAFIRSGNLNPVAVFLVAFVAQCLGLFISYFIARRGGITLLERYGKYVFLSRRGLNKLNNLFKRHGLRLVFAGLYMPGVHGYMGYVAGLGKLNFGVFVLLVLTSTIVWTGALLGIGMMLSDHLDIITQAMNGFGLLTIILIVLVAAGIWYSKHHAK